MASDLIIVASSPSFVALSLTIVALSPNVVTFNPTEVTIPSKMSPRLFRVTSPHPPFRPSAVVLKDTSMCPFISIEGSTISDLPPMGVLYRFLASPLMPSSYQHRHFVDIGSTPMAALPSISDSWWISVFP